MGTQHPRTTWSWSTLARVMVVGLSTLGLVGAPLGPVAPTAPAAAAAADLPVVYLTYDDGPSRYTPAFVELLADHDARATFFVIGQQVPTNHALVRRLLADGHAVANHTWSHPELPRQTDAVVRQQLASTSAAIRDAGGNPTCFRPPYGATDARVEAIAAGLGLEQILWDVDTRDWERQSVASIMSHFGAPRDGMVVLMHDGGGTRHATLAATAELLDRWEGRARFEPLPACTAGGTVADRPVPPVEQPRPSRLPDTDGPRLGFEPIVPVRLLDTRGRARLSADETRVVLPAAIGASQAIAVTLTVVDAAAEGYLQAWNCNGEPSTSVVNFPARSVRAGSATVEQRGDGAICLRSSVAADVIVDVTGRYTLGGPRATLVSERVADTRTGARLGPVWTPLVTGFGPGVVAVSAIVTMTGTGAPTDFVSVLPCAAVTDPGMAPPVSVVNGAGSGANLVAVGVEGGLCAFASGARHVVVDLVAEWGNGTLAYVPIDPIRVLDSRQGIGRTGRVRPGEWAAVATDYGTGRPAGLAGTLTTADAAGTGYASAQPCTQGPPATSTTQVERSPVAGATIVTGSELCVFSSVGTHALFDVTGVFVP